MTTGRINQGAYVGTRALSLSLSGRRAAVRSPLRTAYGAGRTARRVSLGCRSSRRS